MQGRKNSSFAKKKKNHYTNIDNPGQVAEELSETPSSCGASSYSPAAPQEEHSSLNSLSGSWEVRRGTLWQRQIRLQQCISSRQATTKATTTKYHISLRRWLAQHSREDMSIRLSEVNLQQPHLTHVAGFRLITSLFSYAILSCSTACNYNGHRFIHSLITCARQLQKALNSYCTYIHAAQLK